jgi:hypothetical protein
MVKEITIATNADIKLYINFKVQFLTVFKGLVKFYIISILGLELKLLCKKISRPIESFIL